MQYWKTSSPTYLTSINALSLVHQSSSPITRWLSASHPHHRPIQHNSFQHTTAATDHVTGPALRQRFDKHNAKYLLPTCEERRDFFNSIIITLFDLHLRERQIRRCSNDRPSVDDYFRHLNCRLQRAFLGGNQILYKECRNKVNRERKSLQRRYYERNTQALGNDHPKQWNHHHH